MRTAPTHLAATHAARPSRSPTSATLYEATPSGNGVELAEQMRKMAATELDHQLTTSLYRRYVGMVRTALGVPQAMTAPTAGRAGGRPHGSEQRHDHRRRRHEGPVGPAAGDRGESRQRRIHRHWRRRRPVPPQDRQLRRAAPTAAAGLDLVDVRRYGVDRSDFELRYQPGHPAADAAGYVKYPNVNPLIELADMREAQRSYEANLNALQLARTMIGRTLDLCADRSGIGGRSGNIDDDRQPRPGAFRLRGRAEARAGGSRDGPAGGAAPGFASLLGPRLDATRASLRGSEAKSIEALTGKASLQDVVEAVTEAELSLQKMTAVRDRVISAYQEIMRMPI